MLSGRILIVSDRAEVVAELEPVIRAGQHLASVVPDGGEAMRLLADGMIPDVVISDLGSERSFEGIGYVRRFRELNRAGAHVVVTEPGAPVDARTRPAAAQERSWINLAGFWAFQIPLAYLLAKTFELGPLGVFIAIPVAETAITIASVILFKRGKWKLVKI